MSLQIFRAVSEENALTQFVASRYNSRAHHFEILPLGKDKFSPAVIDATFSVFTLQIIEKTKMASTELFNSTYQLEPGDCVVFSSGVYTFEFDAEVLVNRYRLIAAQRPVPMRLTER